MLALSFIKLSVLLAAGCSLGAVLSTLSFNYPDDRASEDAILGAVVGNKGTNTHNATGKGLDTTVSEGVGEGLYSLESFSHRFPRYGSPEFETKCEWTSSSSPPIAPGGEGCSFLARPTPSSGEGLAAWTSVVAAGYIYAKQTGCRLLIDYGPSIEFEQVLMPPKASSVNWSVPKDFVCKKEDRCKVVFPSWNAGNLKTVMKDIGGDEAAPIVHVPNFRWPHTKDDSSAVIRTSRSGAVKIQNRSLKDVFPNFDAKTGMACAFGHVFDFAPAASQFEPGLFSRILPALRDERSFVIALYIRTGRTDKVFEMEKKGEEIEEDTTGLKGRPQSIIDCVLKLEGELLRQDLEGRYTSLTWMLVTDAPNVKSAVKSAYDGKHSNVTGLPLVPRRVLTTEAQGAHTRPERNPSTKDFAEGLIDWLLLGESDVVVGAGGASFGPTGALRTARPFFSGSKNRETGEQCPLRKVLIE